MADNRLPVLEWPASLFESVQASDGPKFVTKKVIPADTCTCGCGKAHRQNFPMTVPSMYGSGFNVYYFASDGCKSRYAKVNGRK